MQNTKRAIEVKSIILSGQKRKAYCERCGTFNQATYAYGPFKFDNGVVAENIMRATCDSCGDILLMAHQSVPLIKEALETPVTRTTMRLPQELVDFMSLQLNRAGARTNQYDLFLRALLLACHGKEDKMGNLLASVIDPVLEQPHTATLSLTFSSNLNRIITQMAESSGISNVSELLRRLIVLAEIPPLKKSAELEASRLILAYT